MPEARLPPSSRAPAIPSSTPASPPRTQETAILAGSVIDSYNNRLKNAYIQWVCLEEKEGAAPIDVSVEDGYFTIPGLKPGAHYKLVGRAKNGERLLAGVTYTTAPNVRVLVRLSEDLAGPETPEVPGSPAFPGPRNRRQKAAAETPERPALAQNPSWGPAPAGGPLPGQPNVAIGAPQAIPEAPDWTGGGSVPPPAPQPPQARPPSGWVPGIVHGDQARNNPPTVRIPAAQERPVSPPAASPDARKQPGAGKQVRVPSIILLGKQLTNFALNDVNGEPWEFQTNRRGKLVLLDFWSTTCMPCRETIPHLCALRNQYGPVGLEVIGIAYEQGDREEQAHRVSRACRLHQTNYRQLLGAGSNCPVRGDFRVTALPTLILIDERGWIIWRHEGTLVRTLPDGRQDRRPLEELEFLLKRRLGVQ